MMSYSIADAIRDLSPSLDKAPSGAASGEWIATTMQAGVSSCEGGYRDANGAFVDTDSTLNDIVGEVAEKLEASQTQKFNKIVVRWTKAKIPFMRGRVNVETMFDEAIVPRGPDDPVYEAAAAARLAFWKTRGDVSGGVTTGQDEPNAYNQTQWFGPHRRVLTIAGTAKLMLATDGLSTPWAGVPDRENGVECELFMEFDVAALDDTQRTKWAHCLIRIGDLVADGFRVASDVKKHGAILLCGLDDDFSPMARIILSRDSGEIDGLPFGAIPLIRATPIAEVEIEDQDLSDDWGVNAAKYALAKRQIAT